MAMSKEKIQTFDFRDLRCFIETAKVGGVTRAARRLTNWSETKSSDQRSFGRAAPGCESAL